jgi:TonB-dependent starch-binding outer membrane protein SusC
MNKFYLSTFVLLMMLGGNLCYAQSQLVNGTVKDPSGMALPGVNILIKGTTTGTTTDTDGKFSLNASPTDVLVVSFIGYASQEVAVGTQTSFNISLEEDLQTLGEVVVVGYGVQDKKVVTAATVTVKADDLMKTNSLRVEQALQGQTPGVQVTNTSGQPGESMKVLVRGAGTTGDAAPLYIVDGVPTNDISYLNPNSIDRVDVLKDAASAAIYGARAANGVVLITTKRGHAGAMTIAFDGYYGVQNAYKKLDLLNGREYATIMNEVQINSGDAPVYSQAQIDAFGEGTDWLGEAFNEDAPMQNYSLMLSGGNDKSVYSTGLTYYSQEGIIGGGESKSKYDRVSFTMNSDHKAYKDVFKIGENFTYSHSNKRGVRVGNLYYNSLRSFMNAPPIYPVFNDDGTYAESPFADDTNPLAVLYFQNFNRTASDKIVGDVYGELSPLKGLTIRSDFGVSLAYDNYQAFNPVYDVSNTFYNANPSATQNMSKFLMWNWDNTIRYDRTFADKHHVELLAGTTAQKQSNFYVNATLNGSLFNDLDFDHNILDNTTVDTVANNVSGSAGNIYALASYFGRINYNFSEKYLLSAIIRKDASSEFGPNNKWATFPSVSVGWVLSEEAFFSGATTTINFLKLRASVGQNGNDRLNKNGYGFYYMPTISSTYREYYLGANEGKSIGSSPDKIANPDLKWETSQQVDIGVEATVLNDFTLTLDYYKKTTKDWLLRAEVPLLVGTGAPYINGGEVVNKGLEAALGYKHVFGGVSVSTNANIAFNDNNVTGITNSEGIIHGPANQLFQGMTEMYRAQVGYPIGYFYGLQVAGIFQNEAEIDSYKKGETLIQPSAVPGDVKFVDVNNDGRIDGQDRTMIGSPIPKITYGFNANVTFKGFDVSIYTYGVHGNEIAFGNRSWERFYNNYTTDILGRWHGEGTSNTQPRVTKNTEPNGNHQFSDLFLQNGSFFRIKSLNIGYDFSSLTNKKPFNQIRLYFAANNLATFTKYRGMDPEVGFAADGWSSGIDVGYYPQPRSYMVGLNLKL